MALLRLSIFSTRNIQKIHAPIGKNFPEKHCHFSGFRIYWEVYRSFLPAPQAGEFSSCTAASGGKQAGKAKLPSLPFFAVFLFCRYSYFQRCHCSVFSLSRRCYHLGSCFFSAPIICRYFLFSGIDSSPVPGSFFSAGVPFLDFREGCFSPFGFLRCRFFGLHPPVLSSYCPIF